VDFHQHCDVDDLKPAELPQSRTVIGKFGGDLTKGNLAPSRQAPADRHHLGTRDEEGRQLTNRQLASVRAMSGRQHTPMVTVVCPNQRCQRPLTVASVTPVVSCPVCHLNFQLVSHGGMAHGGKNQIY
jgi:hypothetical protein